MPFSFRSFNAGVVACALALVVAACGGGGGKHDNTQPANVAPPKVLAVKTSVLRVGTADVQSAGSTRPIDPATGKAVLEVAQSYIDNAVFEPLKNGEVGSGYGALFDAAVKPGTVADADALTDVNVGKVQDLSTKATPVRLTALEDPLGQFLYLAANFDLNIKAKNGEGPLQIVRHVELTFAPTGKSWHITAYRVQAVRKSTARTTTTTTTQGTKP